MADIKELTKKVVAFNVERDWKQFHKDIKDLAISLMLEAGEVLEHFQWKNQGEFEEYFKTHREDVADELADVLYWVLMMAQDLNIDLEQAFLKKLKKNEARYPVAKAKGVKKKYTEL